VAKRLVVSRNAYLDIDRIVEFNDKRNKSDKYSRKFLKSLFEEFDKLKKLPLMGMSTSKENNRLLIWDNYYIYYEITDVLIEITAIYHQKEDFSR
jgi:plasmid stabilization system protein ParE